jgi:adenine phosphoribosyltransferase
VIDAKELVGWIRDVPDFPKPGIMFKDITPLMGDAAAFHAAVEHMSEGIAVWKPDRLVAIEARGFLFAAAIAYRLGVGLCPVRKPGKLPWRSVSVSYELEYGSDALHIHEDGVAAGQRVVIVDDLLATGGTAAAVGRLVGKVGAEVLGYSFLVELGFLKGRQNLGSRPVQSVISF